MSLSVKNKAWLLAVALTWACNASPPIVALTDRDCPEGATVVGAAPPAGLLQRCELPGGVRHGKSRAWYDNGRLRYETEWWQGVKHGKFTLWYANGQKRAEGEDRHGVAHGKWTSWAENGAVEQEQVFEAPEPGVAAEKIGAIHRAATRKPSPAGR
jgi:hypothetical protein